MGFRDNAYATVWEVTSKTPNITQLRISVSRKNKNTGEYETDFSGFISCLGSKIAERALHLHERDRIKLLSTDVTTFRKNDKTYTNFNVYDFEIPESNTNTSAAPTVDENTGVDIANADLPF